MESIYDINNILEHLPHRYPFLLIDRVVECVPNDHIIAHKMVTINEPFFQGHFKNRPVMPGVLVLESMVQAGTFLGVKSVEQTLLDNTTTELVQDLKNNIPNISFYLAGIDQVRFRKEVIPGDCLVIKSTVKQRLNFTIYNAESYVDDELVCSAKFTTAYANQDVKAILSQYGL